MSKNKKNAPLSLWEQQEGEGVKAFEAFCLYLQMGEARSQDKVAKELGKSTTIISKWSAKYKWVDRVAAWTAEVNRQVQQEQINDIKKMRKRHADLATAMLVKAARALKKIPEDDIKPADVSRMVEVASKLERISRGDSETVIEERDGGTATPAVQFYIPKNGRDDDTEEE